ncbi:MAG: 30S ribosomal protein S19 [Candidatus Melainabacteria bacterium]|nr:30S ribosomal protein S19 [Candidatus Melainabacteria bacterium]MBI3308146.1 30S ribosomal protein S19 [Candidatus Melainabacteria bacterium]
MARSLKKGPYVHPSLMRKISDMNKSGKKQVTKTWKRASMVVPEMIGHTIAVHNGKKFVPVYVTEQMIGHRLGEFSMTRYFRAHSGVAKKTAEAAAGAAPAAPAEGKK